MDKISFIVPVYNVEKYLARCIDSLISQTYDNVEVVLIDDCSTDSSALIMKRYMEQDERVKCCFQPVNKGVSAARNLGLDMITGDWVAFCDSDDWYLDDFCEVMLDCARRENSDFVCCQYKVTSGERKEAEHTTDVSCIHWSSEDYIANGSISSCTKLIRKELFDISGVRYPEGCRVYEELPVVPVLAKYADNICEIPLSLYCYFQRGDGSSASNGKTSSEPFFRCSYAKMQEALGPEYRTQYEVHAIYALFYGEILRLCKIKASANEIMEKIAAYEREFPAYMDNPYLRNMGISKVLFLKCVRHKFIFMLRIMAKVHSIIIH